ncbi:MAG: phage holin family protein [Clostridia bacterium]|nr:phage holin family protein [Clostridia bacterium]
MDLTNIKVELLFLLPVLYVIAEIIKRTPLKNWLIPFILWGISVVLVVIYLFTKEINLENLLSGLIQGTLIAMTTIGGNQLYRQATDKRVEDNADAELNKQTSDG